MGAVDDLADGPLSDWEKPQERECMPRKKLNLNLSSREKQELETYLQEHGTQSRIVNRCRIILMTEAGIALQDIADQLGLSKTTVNTWRQIYLTGRLAGLTDRKLPGRPAKLRSGSVPAIRSLTTCEQRSRFRTVDAG